MDVEFKLIGDLTMRQFSYLLAFGLLAYFSLKVVGGIFKYPLTVGFSLLGLGLAFVPIEERGLDEWIINFFRAVYSPTQRVWKKVLVLPSAFMYDSLSVVRQELITLAPTSSRRKLEEYLEGQQEYKPIDPLDIPEADYVLKVRAAFGPRVAVSTAPSQVVGEPAPKPTKRPVFERPPEVGTTKKAEIIKIKEKLLEPISFELPKAQQVTYPTVTPDRHSGRKFTSFLPTTGELTLPIRGEKTLKTSELISAEEDIKKKTSHLKDLLQQIKQTEGIELPKEAVSEDNNAGEISRSAQEYAANLQSETKRLGKEIKELKSKLPEPQKQANKSELQALVDKKGEISAKYLRLQKQTADLHKKMDKGARYADAAPPMPPTSRPLMGNPNTVSGFVKKPNGSPIQGAILIFKDFRSKPVRATKTNALGRFSLTTPLPSGKYTIEINTTENMGFTFDIISLELKGAPALPLEIVGK